MHPFNSHINISQTNNPNFTYNVQKKPTFSSNQMKTVQTQANQNRFAFYPQKDQSEKQKHQLIEPQQNYRGNPLDNILLKNNQVRNSIQKEQTHFQVNQLPRQKLQNVIPQQFNYNMSPLQSGMINVHKIITGNEYLNREPVENIHHIKVVKIIQTPKIQQKIYPRQQYFINLSNWKLDHKKGGLIFINEEKKKNQTKILKFILKKFITTGSFMGISFPTFAMKPESILETYAKACGTAPILFQNVMINAVERIKKVVCFLHTFSIIFADMQKPFNPVLGQTYQAHVNGGLFSAQQICHHPPISAFFYEGKNYKVFGAMELTANIGPNSATGLFLGDIKVQFSDGAWFKGKIISGEYSGFMIGENKFETSGTGYVYDNKQLVCSYSSKQISHNNFQGFIGKLKAKYSGEFFTQIQNNQRFSKFPFYDRKCFEVVYSSMEMIYNSHIIFDGKQYLNLNKDKFLPFLPQSLPLKQLLLSDSHYRKDISLRKVNKFEQAQLQKQRIQQEERMFRKLRYKYDPWHHLDN